MKKGVIVVFEKNDIDSLKSTRIKFLYNNKLDFCFVNNGNDNKVLKFLYKLKEASKSNISILNIRKEKPLLPAVKAAVRFLKNKENIDLIIYTEPKTIYNKDLLNKIASIPQENLVYKREERVLLRKVYSLNELINWE